MLAPVSLRGSKGSQQLGEARRGGKEVQLQMTVLICQLYYSSRMDLSLAVGMVG